MCAWVGVWVFSQVSGGSAEAALLREALGCGIQLVDLEAAEDSHLWGRPQGPMGVWEPPPPRRPLGSVPRWAQRRFTVSKGSPIETKVAPQLGTVVCPTPFFQSRLRTPQCQSASAP